MGDAKRRRDYAAKLAADGIHSMSGYDVKPEMPPLVHAILHVFHEEAAKRSNGMIPSDEIETALLFHLVQLCRSTPTHYKQKRIDACCDSIRELSLIPIRPDQIVTLGDEAGDA